MQRETSADLRARAKHLRANAQFAERSVDMLRDIETAKKLEAQATQLEAQQKAGRESYESRRKRLVAKVKIAQKQIGLDDDTYRDFLAARTAGKRSAADLTIPELDNVLRAMAKQGFRPRSTAASRSTVDAQTKKLRSLWLELHDSGKVRDPSERALANWAKGQTRKTNQADTLQWLSVSQKQKLIEELKKWLARR